MDNKHLLTEKNNIGTQKESEKKKIRKIGREFRGSHTEFFLCAF